MGSSVRRFVVRFATPTWMHIVLTIGTYNKTVIRQNENRSQSTGNSGRDSNRHSLSHYADITIIPNSHLKRTVSLPRSWWHRATLIYFNGVTDVGAALIRAAKLHY